MVKRRFVDRDKIIEWAKKNGYSIEKKDFVPTIEFGMITGQWFLSKEYTKKYNGEIRQYIVCTFVNTYELDLGYNTYSYIMIPNKYSCKQQIQDLFIPMNRVKADEENLIKFLEEEIDVKD